MVIRERDVRQDLPAENSEATFFEIPEISTIRIIRRPPRDRGMVLLQEEKAPTVFPVLV